MKRYLNYLLLIANLLIVVMAAVVMIIFNSSFNDMGSKTINQIYSDLKPMLAFPIVTTIISCGIIGLYVFLLKKEASNEQFPLNPRLLSALNKVGLISLANIFCSPTLTIAAILVMDESGTMILLWTSLGLAILFGILSSGFISFFNLRISYAKIQRETLMNEAKQENEKKIEDKAEKKVVSKVKSQKSKKTKDEESKITEATSGSFN
ncbi:MAG: hypothetical protein ACRC4M_02065 [Mycoplasma sp.]